ncbi:MAG TPA: DUF308 domain-containing protein [Alphaproteobacteria bacterium]|jgi:uncharacterized membrane protein HdeD (DUF308 family)
MNVAGSSGWLAMVLCGVLALAFGAVVLIWPASALEALVVLFGAFVLIQGVAGVLAALHARATALPWQGMLLVGLAGIVAGLIAFAWPGATVTLAIYVAAVWAIIKGVFELSVARRMRRDYGVDRTTSYGGWAWLLFGALLFLWPIIGVVAVAWLIGLVALLFGAVLTVLGLNLRRHLQGV